MSEPLKNKIYLEVDHQNTTDTEQACCHVAKAKDIQSAVEWLKETLIPGLAWNDQKYAETRINQAFEDVTKNE